MELSSSNHEEMLLTNLFNSPIIQNSKIEINGETVIIQENVDGSSLLELEQPAFKQNSKGEPFNYDDIMELHIGQLGKFQLRTFFLLCVPALFPGLIAMSYTFTGAVPNYRQVLYL